MAWCRQATSHYLCRCWARSMVPYGITTGRPQRVNHAGYEEWFQLPASSQCKEIIQNANDIFMFFTINSAWQWSFLSYLCRVARVCWTFIVCSQSKNSAIWTRPEINQKDVNFMMIIPIRWNLDIFPHHRHWPETATNTYISVYCYYSLIGTIFDIHIETAGFYTC